MRVVRTSVVDQNGADAPDSSVPPAVLRARQRAGVTGRCTTVRVTVSETSDTPAMASPCQTLRRLLQHIGEEQDALQGRGYFLYLAVHPIPDRKKNSFIAVSRDPIRAVYEYNHGQARGKPRRITAASAALSSDDVTADEDAEDDENASEEEEAEETVATRKRPAPSKRGLIQKEAPLAAPYLAIASVIGPLLSQSLAQMAAEAWAKRIRGTKSKFVRGHAIAEFYGVPYYGDDVQVARDTIATHLDTCVTPGAGTIFRAMRTDLVTKARGTTASETMAPPSLAKALRVFTADDLFTPMMARTTTAAHASRELFTMHTPPIVFCV